MNVNSVWGMDDGSARAMVAPLAWLAATIVGIAFLICGPTSLFPRRHFRTKRTVSGLLLLRPLG
ncbi:calcium homeostasis modulator protein [Methylobacterium sp. J-070]|uniref:calcium homeostasis modulator protein n=1 Tax=Methylobacterium sp. J-070 TaxID=2836650 RepID=UPI001FBBE54E|nr:calcium homeostasis modulator protein [Methylobacterium sp. J-070]MCJ2052600.1 calcium homeostasis modulator protein [Methylobacterium sp. J-070]